MFYIEVRNVGVAKELLQPFPSVYFSVLDKHILLWPNGLRCQSGKPEFVGSSPACGEKFEPTDMSLYLWPSIKLGTWQ